MDNMSAVQVDLSSLPSLTVTSMDFHDTAFFQTSTPDSPVPQLPTPAAVRTASDRSAPATVSFEHLNLFVKFGPPSYVRLEEALALRAINKAFPDNRVPTPELFGWREDQGDLFLYMSLIRGPTLRGAWDSLTREDKESICSQLSQIVATLRQIVRPSSLPLIGSIIGSAVQDLYFRRSNLAGPFPDVKAFNDAFQAEAIPIMPVSQRPPDPYRGYLPDTANVYFTHGDLNRKNIIISDSPGPRRIAAIVDWEQAGWYPEYWEYCKLLLAEPWMEEWRDAGWADKVMTVYEGEWVAFSEYWQWRQP